jgi:thiol-disulfide isomerase/thioredoxin
MKQNRFVCVVILAGLLFGDSLLAQSGVKPPQSIPGIAGQQAPEWDVSKWYQLPEGIEDLDITDYRGRVLYLYFFQSWCPGCHSTGFPNLKKLYKKYKDDPDVEFVVIQTTFEGHQVNTADKLKPTARKFDLPVPFGQSAGGGTPAIMQKYRTRGTPWVVLIDKAGRVEFNDFHLDPANASRRIDQLKER